VDRERGAAVTVSEGLAAALLQISQHAGRLSELDTREGEHHQAVGDALAKLHTAVGALQGTVTDHGQILASLDGLGDSVTSLAAQVASLMPAPGKKGQYQPIATVQWHSLTDEEHDAAVARIGSWVAQVYRPCYGHLARQLGPCWAQHPLCLVQLDWLSELWSVLHLQPARTARDLAAQAELGTRITPAIAEQLAAETSACEHARRPGGRPAAAAAGSWPR
jgi:hypothetical protein